MDACDMDEMEVVDLGLGAEGYKERFGNSTRQTLHVTLTRSWPRHHARNHQVSCGEQVETSAEARFSCSMAAG